jgi:hypothetical protein
MGEYQVLSPGEVERVPKGYNVPSLVAPPSCFEE